MGLGLSLIPPSTEKYVLIPGISLKAFKEIPGIRTYFSVDGGMSDNPRPITYQSNYSACLVSNPFNMNSKNKYTIAGKHCESGDVLFKEVDLPL